MKDYRKRYLKKFDLPDEEEREIYRKQLRNWLETDKIVDPATYKDI